MMLFRQRRFLPFLLAIFLIGLHCRHLQKSLHVRGLKLEVSHLLRASEPHSTFWRAFAPILVATEPKCGGVRCDGPKIETDAEAKGRDESDSWETDRPQNMIEMPDDWVNSLRDAHSLFLDMIKYGGPELEYRKGTRGIVTTAAPYHLPVLSVSLLMLRRTGSNLPVEVLIASREEYEPLICDVFYPSLNAKCIILPDIIGHSKHKIEVGGFQFKVFAMLFSSFENNLFLDSDNFPVHPPELLFEAAPYTTHHFVLWTDFWTPTFSHLFPAITGIDLENLQRRPTIEAGQLMISKKTHAKTLLLAAYYNTYGEYYYPLTVQGGPGEGDKETFAAAALVLHETLYTVSQPPNALGPPGPPAEVLQYDPIADFQCASSPNCTTAPRPFFIHCGWPPKMNALHNVRTERQFGGEELSMELFGVDLEPVVWGYMVDMACEDGLEFRDWGEGNKSSTPVCQQTRKSFEDMFGREYVKAEGWEMQIGFECRLVLCHRTVAAFDMNLNYVKWWWG